MGVSVRYNVYNPAERNGTTGPTSPARPGRQLPENGRFDTSWEGSGPDSASCNSPGKTAVPAARPVSLVSGSATLTHGPAVDTESTR